MLTASIISLATLTLLSIFQLLLIFGAPLGHFAWGGQNITLSRKLRFGSAISIATYFVFAIFIMSKAGIWIVISNRSILDMVLWAITCYLILGIFLNAISRSKLERYTMTPVTLILAICLFFIASS